MQQEPEMDEDDEVVVAGLNRVVDGQAVFVSHNGDYRPPAEVERELQAAIEAHAIANVPVGSASPASASMQPAPYPPHLINMVDLGLLNHVGNIEPDASGQDGGGEQPSVADEPVNAVDAVVAPVAEADYIELEAPQPDEVPEVDNEEADNNLSLETPPSPSSASPSEATTTSGAVAETPPLPPRPGNCSLSTQGFISRQRRQLERDRRVAAAVWDRKEAMDKVKRPFGERVRRLLKSPSNWLMALLLLILVVVCILSVLNFVATYANAEELDQRLTGLESEVRRTRKEWKAIITRFVPWMDDGAITRSNSANSVDQKNY